MVARNQQGRVYVELLGDDLRTLDNGDFLAIAARLTDLPLRRGSLTCDEVGQRLTLLQQEPFSVSAGAAALPRTGNSVSGDTCCWFKGADGILRVILCDGMGSGSSAAQESRLMVKLLEDLLRAGMEPKEALNTVNQAMALQCDLGGGFSTVDLLTVDLFTKAAVLYKLGAAPSYLCRGGRVSRIAGGTFPAGLSEGEADVTRISLEPRDVLVLISDGISDGTDDGWLRECLSEGVGLSAKSLAHAILTLSDRHTGGRDDRSVVVLRLNQKV
jgi:stage II sporulation protein E